MTNKTAATWAVAAWEAWTIEPGAKSIRDCITDTKPEDATDTHELIVLASLCKALDDITHKLQAMLN